jgi:phage portal protein BeeE
VRLVDRVLERYRTQGYYEGLASGAAVLTSYGSDSTREGALQQVVAAAQQAYSTNGVVFACVLTRMMLLSEARFQMQSLVDKGLYGTPDLAILEHPWPNGTTAELIARMEQDASTGGTAFVWKPEPDRLVRMPPDEVTIISEVKHGPAGHYREVIGVDWDPNTTNLPGLGPGQGEKSETAQTLPIDEVAIWAPYPDPQANFRGISWLTPVMTDVQGDSGLTAYKTQYLDHAATPNMLVQYPQKLRPDTIDRVVERMSERYGGVTNAFRTIVLDQGATGTVVGSTFDQMDYSHVQGVGEDRICAAAGVDPVLLGLLTIGRPSVAYMDAIRRMADLTCRPLWRSMCSSLQKLVPNVPASGVRLWYDVSDIAALRQGELERAQATQVKAAALITFVQAGFTHESAVAALSADDVTLLKKDLAPATVQKAPSGGQSGVPRAPTGITQAQTPASKLPSPNTFANLPSVNGASHG